MIDNYQHRCVSVMYNVHYAYNLAVFDDGEVFSLGESFSLTPSLWGESFLFLLHRLTFVVDHVPLSIKYNTSSPQKKTFCRCIS